MSKMSWLVAAAAAALASACVSHPTSSTSQLSRSPDRDAASAARRAADEPATAEATTEAPAAQAEAAQPPAAPQTAQAAPGSYTDAQVRGFVASRDAIGRLTPGTTPEAQAANQQQVGQILAQNGLTGEQYNAMAAASRTDQALANRISAASVSNVQFTDAQLRSFAQASAQIDPINRSLATATPEARSAAATQIRAILQQNNIDQQTYNGIAARAQTDQQLAQRIAQLRATPDSSGE